MVYSYIIVAFTIGSFSRIIIDHEYQEVWIMMNVLFILVAFFIGYISSAVLDI